LRPRLGHRRQRPLLEVRRALDGLDEVRDEVEPPLLDVLDVRPRARDGDVLPDEVVVDLDTPAEHTEKDDERDRRHDATAKPTLHPAPPLRIPERCALYANASASGPRRRSRRA